jgi:hypothetical protein
MYKGSVQPYPDNIFCWNAAGFLNPGDNTVVLSKVTFVGSGGIKINETRTEHNRYMVFVEALQFLPMAAPAAGALGGTTSALHKQSFYALSWESVRIR